MDEQRHAHPGGYTVGCYTCGADLFHSLWYDVAERFADTHEDATGHQAWVEEVGPGHDH